LVIFDLDGTLVDSLSDIAEAVNRTLAGRGLPAVPESAVRSWLGDGSTALIRTAFAHVGGNIDIQPVMPEFMRHYQDCLLRDLRLYPGVIDTLEALKQKNVTLAICSNKPEQFIRPLLEALKIDACFSAILGGNSLAESKPSGLPLRYLAEKFAVPVSRCLMVGDSSADLHAAENAGMPAALVSYGYTRDMDLKSVSARVVDDIREILSPA
jgi:phosphoglycolate phosphatase